MTDARGHVAAHEYHGNASYDILPGVSCVRYVPRRMIKTGYSALFPWVPGVTH